MMRRALVSGCNFCIHSRRLPSALAMLYIPFQSTLETYRIAMPAEAAAVTCPAPLVMARRFSSWNEEPLQKVKAALHGALSVTRMMVPDKKLAFAKPLDPEVVLYCCVLEAALGRLSTHSLSTAVVEKILDKQPVDAAHEILAATAPESLMQALVDASQWERMMSLVLERQSHRNVGITSRLLYLAAFRVPDLRLRLYHFQLTEVVEQMHLNRWDVVADLIMKHATSSSKNTLRCQFDKFWHDQYQSTRFLGVLDLLTDSDFVAMLLGQGHLLGKSSPSQSNLTLRGLLNHVLCALAYTCLRWDSMDSPNANDMAEYGVIVDNIVPREFLHRWERVPHEVTSFFPGKEGPTRCVMVKLCRCLDGHLDRSEHYMLEHGLHRYSVAEVYVRLALAIEGEKTWTRLGFERIIMDMCYLDTLMALNTTESELSPPPWEKDGAASQAKSSDTTSMKTGEKEALNIIEGLWPASPAAKYSDKTAKKTQLKRKEKENIQSRFDFTMEGINIIVHKRAEGYNLFNDASLDPLRLLKAKLWSLARNLKVRPPHAMGFPSGPTRVIRTHLPPPDCVDAVKKTTTRITTTSGGMKVKYTHAKASPGDDDDVLNVTEDHLWPSVYVEQSQEWKRVIPTAWLHYCDRWRVL